MDVQNLEVRIPKTLLMSHKQRYLSTILFQSLRLEKKFPQSKVHIKKNLLRNNKSSAGSQRNSKKIDALLVVGLKIHLILNA